MKTVTQTKIKKWGNSFGVRLPINFINQKGITDGTPVQLSQNNNSIKIQFFPKDKKQSLKDLVSQIKPENLHNETNWGNVQGQEIW